MPALPAPATAQTLAMPPSESHLSAVEMFALAERMRDQHRPRDALAIFDALERDPDPEIRAEARFRKGMMLADAKRYAEAAVTFRALLDEKPGATRVRLELARVLAAMGEDVAARRAIRQAMAAGLPADVGLVAEKFANSLRSRRRFGGSLEIALAPDGNVNRATSARTLDTIIAPLALSRDARERSGLGFHFAGQAYARLPIGDAVAIVPRVSTQGDIYGRGAFDDISTAALLGLEWQIGRDRLSPSVGETWRWYGGPLYAHTQVATLDWLHPAGKAAQVDAQISASRAHYARNALQDGGIYSASLSYEREIGTRTGGSLTLDVTRQSANDPGYATWSGGGSLLLFRTIGRTTAFLSGGVHRLEGDERLFLFPERRREWLWQASVGATFRRFEVAGFAPVVRLSYERNVSTVGLYDYHRLSGQIGITRAF